MKRKYFVRGLGVGILFGALIMFAAYMTSGKNRMSDEDVIKRAQELGMVKQSEYVLESDVTSQETTTKLRPRRRQRKHQRQPRRQLQRQQRQKKQQRRKQPLRLQLQKRRIRQRRQRLQSLVV